MAWDNEEFGNVETINNKLWNELNELNALEESKKNYCYWGFREWLDPSRAQKDHPFGE